jgi:hypothetical protein
MKRMPIATIPVERIILDEAARILEAYERYFEKGGRYKFLAGSLRALGHEHGAVFEAAHIKRLIEGRIRK